MSENGKLSRYWLHELTRPAFEDWLENEPEPVIVLGLGAIEQHGPHLPLGTDSLDTMSMIEEIGKRSNSVCVMPSWVGYSPHHMGFKGTITYSEETYLGVILDTIGSLAEHGVKRFVFYSGHGGNMPVLNLAMQIARRKFKVMCYYAMGPRGSEVGKKIMERMVKHNDLHSGVNETSAALHLFPELCEMWRLDDWEPMLKVDPKVKEYMDPEHPEAEIARQVAEASREPSTHHFTSDGIYGTNDPRTADPEEYAKRMDERAQYYTDFIKLWKTAPVPKGYR